MPPVSKKPSTKLGKTLQTKGVKTNRNRSEPLWKGPHEDGITQSLLTRFLACRERFRLLVVEGLQPHATFSAPLEYGNMWHVCEEQHARGVCNWADGLRIYCAELCKKYRTQQDQVNHWYELCKAQFPIYVEWWANHQDVKDRTPLLQEQTFNVPYTLPSGRVVRMRGKFDSVDLIGKGKNASIYIQENKTKSSIDGLKLQRQLSFDLQTMFYTVALQSYLATPPGLGDCKASQVAGVRYNVVRRSAHKSTESMLKKLNEDIAAGRGEEWFARWKIEISDNDVQRFKAEFLNHILEQLCDWWAWVSSSQGRADPFGNPNLHWRFPYGTYSSIIEGAIGELDEYIATGSEVGLQRATTLFGELE